MIVMSHCTWAEAFGVDLRFRCPGYRSSYDPQEDVVRIRRADNEGHLFMGTVIAQRSLKEATSLPREEFWEWVETEVAIDKIKGDV